MSYQGRRNAMKLQMKQTGGVSGEESWKAVRHNNKVLKDSREGEYLIKQTGDWAGYSHSYVQYDYSPDSGWFATGRRSEAAWFKREELPEILPHFKRGFKLVKLSKNKR